MKRKNHYKTEQQILDRIDSKRFLAVEYNKAAEECEAHANEATKLAQKLTDQWDGKTGKKADEGRAQAAQARNDFFELKKQARENRKKAKRIEETQLPNLGEALSEFRTQPMALLGSDHSVACTT